MSLLYKNVKQVVFDIDEFIDTVEQGLLVFREGVINYIRGGKASFADKIKRINRLEATAGRETDAAGTWMVFDPNTNAPPSPGTANGTQK